MARLNLSPPWDIRVSEINQLFKNDEEVHVVYDDINYELKLYVDNPNKATALTTLLPEEYIFGNVNLKVTVVPANKKTGVSKMQSNEELFNCAFEGNEAFSFAVTIQGIFTNNLTYVVFKNTVVQYFNDDIGDVNGMCSTLYQEIAKNIFGEREGVFFCTDKPKFPSLTFTTNSF